MAKKNENGQVTPYVGPPDIAVDRHMKKYKLSGIQWDTAETSEFLSSEPSPAAEDPIMIFGGQDHGKIVYRGTIDMDEKQSQKTDLLDSSGNVVNSGENGQAIAKFAELTEPPTNLGEQANLFRAKSFFNSQVPFNHVISKKTEDDEEESEATNAINLQFADDIRILLIPTPDSRIIAHFIGVSEIKKIKSAPAFEPTLIGLLHHQCLIPFMESKGYTYAGEINFDNQWNLSPCAKYRWTVKGEEVVFTNGGFQFFQHSSGDKDKNIAVTISTMWSSMQAGVTIHSRKMSLSKKLQKDLTEFTKNHNCLRGAKLRDINVLNGRITDIPLRPEYNWDNYYFSKEIQQTFQLQVFGFLENTARYNAMGITKRGILMHGSPGCVLSDTKIKIRKVSKEGSHIIYIQ